MILYVLEWIESVREGTENNGDVCDLHAHMQASSVPTEMKIQDMIYAQRARRSVLNKACVESNVRPGQQLRSNSGSSHNVEVCRMISLQKEWWQRCSIKLRTFDSATLQS